MSGHSPPLAFIYSIISTKEFFFFFLPLGKLEPGHSGEPAGHFSLHKCSFHGVPVRQRSRQKFIFLFCLFFFTQTGAHFSSLQMEDKAQLIVGPQGHKASEKIQRGT